MAVFCALAVIGVRGWTQESVADATISMDWAGIAPLAVALGCVLTAFNEAGKLADANWLLVVILLLVGAVCLVVFWNIEKRVRHPLVTVDYLKQRRTWALLSTTLLTMTGVFAVMNGLIPNLGQDTEVGAGMSADVVSFYTLTPYALAGLVFGPIAGWMAAQVGYKFVLQTGLVGTVVGLIVTVFIVGNPGKLSLLLVSLLIGITYAGIANIMLNGLGIVLSPADNQGYLPGMNAGAFNLGAGLSFAILFGVAGSFNSGYHAGLVTGCIILAAALAMSLLIPKPESIGDTVAAANHD